MDDFSRMFDLTGKTALVTGSTQGIGQAAACCLAAHGAQVIVHGSASLAKAERTADKIRLSGGNARCAVADLSREGCAQALYEQTGPVDILMLNASVQFRRPWNEISAEEFHRQVRVNFQSSLELIQLYAPHMAQQGWGRILTVGSVQQYKPHRDMLVYAATKEAAMSMVKNLAKQLAPQGVTVNNLSPGVIATPRNEEALGDPDYARQVYAGIPAGYAGLAEDCCGAVLLLCSPSGRYITGADLVVDGGMHL